MESTNSIPLRHDLLKSLQQLQTEAHEHKYNVQVEDLHLQSLMDTLAIHIEHNIIYHFVYNQRWKLNVLDASRQGKNSILLALDINHIWKYESSSYNMYNGNTTIVYHDVQGNEQIAHYSIPDAMFLYKLQAHFKKQQCDYFTITQLNAHNNLETMYYQLSW